ncbi:hypothetical protein GF412_00395 [Candidatus Micrarchaeota archaeon]|nr:hypothetical protein [Candidatus Micrarchaeota archaeon]MBD3417434.1 hypothetical protein [Candidatus Micrarchaeota archaeon]
MGSKQTPMDRLYRAQRSSRIDSIPRIRMGSSGKRFSVEVRAATTKMRVEVRRLSFIRRTEKGKLLSCELSFYITGKAMVMRSMEWKRTDKGNREYMKTPADEESCKEILDTLRDLAVRHNVSSIYASKQHIAPILLLRLGFNSLDARDHMCLEVQKPLPKH